VPTTIHVPASLLEKIDARAKALGVSRNRFILQALADKVDVPLEWPEEFVRALKHPVRGDVAALADELERAIERGHRNRKQPPRF
jgi:hypothetical protein